MAIFIDKDSPDLANYPDWILEHYKNSARQYWHNEYQASNRKDLFVFETKYGNGVDTISDFGANDKIRLRDFDGAFDDLTFEVDASANTITIRLKGTDGDDTLTAHWGDATLIGGNGYDVLNGGWGDDYLKGGRGDDKLNGSWGDDILKGNEGDDCLDGSRGDDTLHGGKGNDVLMSSHGDDIP